MTISKTQFKTIIVEEDQHKLGIILNRPDKKNAINSVMTNELLYVFDHANKNDGVRVIQISAMGDGFLQLENKLSPLEGGLTLVAHPKGKNVRRLASMSGGEKSLTALSFLFALQKYKPSPFYALDEVDSFLDGINVERLSKLIISQSANAQFIVVSHRRPMINASMRTIGVAQARGSHTQVIGLPNAA